MKLLHLLAYASISLGVLVLQVSVLKWTITQYQLEFEADLPEWEAGEVVSIWPAPKHVKNGSRTLVLSSHFVFKTNAARSELLRKAMLRYTNIVFRHERLDDSQSGKNFVLLDALNINVRSWAETDQLQLGVNESYRLQVPDPTNRRMASLEAETIYGALRGLETFSQLCTYDFDRHKVEIHNCPWDIMDEPRFQYRGLLIDTARHYQPLSVIQSVIDSMAYAKLNVLHWHVVDEQSFPLEIPTFPKLWEGAFSHKERYTIRDAKSIIEYAGLQGINVMLEIDVPGHAKSWGLGYPDLWPAPNCTMPLDVSNEFTFELIDGILSALSKVFPFKLLHLGGDEVDTSCWETTPHVKKWMMKRSLTAKAAYTYFVLRVQKLAINHGFTPVNWQETFQNFGAALSTKTIVHSWWGPEVAPNVVKTGLRCIVSEQSSRYLDHLHLTWEKFYESDPLDGITEPEEQKLIVGGQVCMWGETVDASNILQTIWPRAAAAAERFWSPKNVSGRGIEDAARRLEVFRCQLNDRGIPAAPLHVQGQAAPKEPGSCYRQR